MGTTGPLSGLRVVEMAAIGPVPMCGMLLADMGADLIRIDRRMPTDDMAAVMSRSKDPIQRGRRSILLDLRQPEGVEVALSLLESSAVLIEGSRPGVMERLGLGPEECFARNAKLVYGRMTGWGQEGPLAQSAGHDINYIALTGALHSIGTPGGPPIPPLNLVGDYGGGTLYLTIGVLAALREASVSGRGQVVDAAMIDGANSLMSGTYAMNATGMWKNERGANVLNGVKTPCYRTYETSDGKWISIGAGEPHFYQEMLHRIGCGEEDLPGQYDEGGWAKLGGRLEEVFRSKTRAEWCEILEGTDACFSPVLDLNEAPEHPHNKARGAFVDVGGVTQPAPAPRFSRTPSEVADPPCELGAHSEEILDELGFSERLTELRDKGVVG